MTIMELYEILKIDENENMECKKSSSDLPRDMWETYSSFANTDGGIILLGV